MKTITVPTETVEACLRHIETTECKGDEFLPLVLASLLPPLDARVMEGKSAKFDAKRIRRAIALLQERNRTAEDIAYEAYLETPDGPGA